MSKSTKGQPSRKRPAKQPEDFFWDCSVCTYKNNPEAFKCVMCDVRKGTSTRKSRINPDLVAVQVQHALLPPPLPPKLLAGMREQEDDEDEDEQEQEEAEAGGSQDMPPPASPAEEQPSPSPSTSTSVPSTATPKNQAKKTPAAKPKSAKPVSNRSKFKNVDRKNATSTEITVDNVTIMITEYKLKPKKEKKESNSGNSSLVGDPPHNEDSLDRPSTSSKQGSGAESDGGEQRSAGARGGSEELETTRSS